MLDFIIIFILRNTLSLIERMVLNFFVLDVSKILHLQYLIPDPSLYYRSQWSIHEYFPVFPEKKIADMHKTRLNTYISSTDKDFKAEVQASLEFLNFP